MFESYRGQNINFLNFIYFQNFFINKILILKIKMKMI